jgi:GTP-binding protein EngB required for normal cell division
MESMLDAAISNSNEEQEHNKIFLELRSSIMTYINKHDSIKQINVDDLLETFDEDYSLSLIFSQLLHLCASTQRYYLHSTSNDNLFIEKIL